MRVPQLNERVKEAPAHALRSLFGGIGSLLSVSDKIRNKPATAEAPASAPTAAPETAAPADAAAPEDAAAPIAPFVGDHRLTDDLAARFGHEVAAILGRRQRPRDV